MSEQHEDRYRDQPQGSFTQFLVGACATAAGAYMLTSRISVSSGWGRVWGFNSFGLALLPLLVGISLLFFGGRAAVGWALVVIGGAIIGGGILMNLSIYFRPTTLFDTIVMFGLVAGGLGLVARSLQPRS